MKKIILFLALILILPITTSIIQEPVGTPCLEGEDCELNNLIVQNFTVIGDSFNVTFQIITINVTNMSVDFLTVINSIELNGKIISDWDDINLSVSEFLKNITDFNMTNGRITNKLVVLGTATAEQLTSTDDATISDLLSAGRIIATNTASTGTNSFSFGRESGTSGGTGIISATGDGSIALGFSEGKSTISTIISSGKGSLAGGHSDGSDQIDDTLIEASGNGALAWGSAYNAESAGAILKAASRGSIALGLAEGGLHQSTRIGAVVIGTNVQATQPYAMGFGRNFINSEGATIAFGITEVDFRVRFKQINIPQDNSILTTGLSNDIVIGTFDGTQYKTYPQIGFPIYNISGFPLVNIENNFTAEEFSHFGNSTDYTQINNEGQLELFGEARPVRELIFKATNVAKGASAPTDDLRDIGSSGGVKDPVISFSKTIQQDVYGSFHPPDDLDNTVNVSFHLMWIAGESWTSGAYNWTMEYIIKCENLSYEATLGADCANSTTGTPIILNELVTPNNAEDFIETIFTDTINMNRQEVLTAHFFRDVTDDADDVGEVRFFEIEYTVNTLGEYNK